MLRFYKYLYYRLYSWNLNTWGEKDMPQWNALIGVSFMMFTNFCTVGIVLQFFKFINFFFRDEVPKKELIVLMLSIGCFNFFRVISHGKYREIANSFKKEDKKTKNRNTYLLWLYTIMSFISFFGLAVLYGKIYPIQ